MAWGRWTPAIILLVCTLVPFVYCKTGSHPHQVPSHYAHHGPKRIGAVVQALAVEDKTLRLTHGVPTVQPLHTVLMTRDGHIYTSRLEIAPLRRQLASSSSSSSAGLAPDLQCDGCPSTDVRVQVQNSKAAPFNAVGMLQRHGKNDLSGQVAQCTGTLITETHVLTAAHCLVDSDTWSQIGEIDFYPAVNGAEVFPSVTAQYSRVLQQYVDQGGVSPTSLNYDFGLITLSAPAPKGTTHMQIAAGQGTANFLISTAGYPGDKQEATMWTEQCGNIKFQFQGSELGGSQYDNIVQHTCVAYNGQSGSGLWDNNGTVRAVLTGVLTTSRGDNINTATELNPFVYNTLANWINEDKNATYLPLAPATPSSPGSTVNSWIRDHLYVPVVPAVIVGLVIIAVLIFCCSCLPRLRRRKAKPPSQQPQVWVNGMGQPVQWPSTNAPYPPPEGQFPHQWNPARYGHY